MMPTSDWADLMYAGPHAKLSHWVPWGLPTALCGAQSSDLSAAHTSWYGTGDMDEFDRAEALPLCTNCEEAAHVDAQPKAG